MCTAKQIPQDQATNHGFRIGFYFYMGKPVKYILSQKCFKFLCDYSYSLKHACFVFINVFLLHSAMQFTFKMI